MSQTMPEPGQVAPDFTLPQDGGDPVTLSALRPAPWSGWAIASNSIKS